LGGEMDGNWVTGSEMSARAPINTMMSDITMDNTGLWINLLNMAGADYSAFSFSFAMTSAGFW
jgi:hypothetical protein